MNLELKKLFYYLRVSSFNLLLFIVQIYFQLKMCPACLYNVAFDKYFTFTFMIGTKKVCTIKRKISPEKWCI